MAKRHKITMPEHKVTVIRDTNLVMPELYMEVYVEGDLYEQQAFARMFVQAKCTKAESPETADLVVFTGGSDVNPVYYDEERHHTTRPSPQRDMSDLKLYETCLSAGIPMFGVCRGAQFLHVMNGGKLYQDVDNHTGDHPMWDVRLKRVIPRVSSVHHQACILNLGNGMELLGESHRSKVRWKNPTEKVEGSLVDVEAFFYRETMCFGVQGHPEYKGYHQFLQWTLQQIYQLFVESPDIELQGRCRRLKKEILDERTAKWLERLKELN